ncbi:hypothetical protein JD844_016203, partial [Phrynosoma platyrhinos]
YEICGIENIPEGPAVLVYYHGAIAIDYYFFIFTLYRITEGHLLGIAPGGIREQDYSDNTYKLVWGKRNGFAQVAIDAKVLLPFSLPGTLEHIRQPPRVIRWLLLSASPSFLCLPQISERDISYMETYVRPMRWLYEKTRLLIFPMCGLFPVKFRTHIGQPIPYDPNITAEELAEKTKIAMEALRDKHQKIPGNILRALGERFVMHHRNE